MACSEPILSLPEPEERPIKLEIGPDGPTWDDVRTFLHRLAVRNGEWAGYPLPVVGPELVMEPRFPHPALNGLTANEEEEEEEEEDTGLFKKYIELMAAQTATAEWATLSEEEKSTRKQQLRDALQQLFPSISFVNSWYSEKRHATLQIHRVNGKLEHQWVPCYGGPKITLWINTLMASNAWTSEMEENALRKLKTLLNPHQYNGYVLTGTFMEKSEKSGMHYMFRKLRPTLAMRVVKDQLEMAACLCLHPQGYYARSWAGVMCPTDDVICHVILMRGDERRYWAKANHHEYYEAEAGM